MQTLLRVAAVLAFGFCFLAGVLIVVRALSSGSHDAVIIVAMGLVFMGMAFFVGPMVLLAAEKLRRKTGSK